MYGGFLAVFKLRKNNISCGLAARWFLNAGGIFFTFLCICGGGRATFFSFRLRDFDDEVAAVALRGGGVPP